VVDCNSHSTRTFERAEEMKGGFQFLLLLLSVAFVTEFSVSLFVFRRGNRMPGLSHFAYPAHSIQPFNP
jgi:hypothetical protein